jgi:DNA polymerase-1
MKTKSGEQTNAVYGYTAVLIKALREFKPKFVALTLDKKGPTFRHEEYKEYKATRVKAPQELYDQFDRVRQVTTSFGIPIFELSGFEADDLIGTIAHSVDGQVEKIIVTGDMDTMQLVNDHTKVYTMSHGLSDSIIYDREAVMKRFSGLTPEQMIDYKALRGDPSDNIPGIRGIGEKTAIDLLTEFKTVDGIYKHLDSPKIKDRVRELLKEHKEEGVLSKRLATIRTDATIKFNLEEARFGDFDQQKLVELFTELEFKSLLPRVYELTKGGGSKEWGKREEGGERGGKGEMGAKDKTGERGEAVRQDKFERNKKLFKYTLVDDEKKFKKFLAELKKQKEFTFDTETAGFDVFSDRLLGISFSWKKGEAYFVKIQDTRNKKQTDSPNLFNYNQKEKKAETNDWLEQLKPIFENPKIKKAGHNIKFDLGFMCGNGIKTKGVDFDTMIAAYLINPGSRQYSLDAVTFAEFGFEKISKDDLLGRGRERITFPEVPIEKLSLYSCEDADFTNRLVAKLAKELKKEKTEKLFREIEMPLVPVLCEMEIDGVKLDVKYLAELAVSTHKKINKLEKKIHELAGMDFNIKSTQQLAEVLFEKLELSTAGIGKTKTGISTGADELEKLKDQHPIIKLIMEYREFTKLASTYIDSLPKQVNQKTGRLHTSFNQTIAATGRLSSIEPNLQNIPVRTELGREIRSAFVADRGYKLVSLDYSQIELRLAAHFSADKKMIETFKKGEDIHRATAAAINEVALEAVTPQMRREAKATNFGILYGQGPHGLSATADIPYMKAKEFIDHYFEVYKGVKKYIEETVEEAKQKGFVETLYGRRRYLPEINSSVMQIRKAAERMAVNTPLQGTAADLIKVAMIEIAKVIKDKYNKDEVKMILQVHDELLFEIKDSLAEKAAKEFKDIMEQGIKLKVPVEVDIKIGKNWGEMEG